MMRPDLPVGSPERHAFFARARETFVVDWAAAAAEVEQERRAKLGDLYFVTAGNAVKIGRTTDFKTRLRFIQAHNHEKVECAALLNGEGWRERSYHSRFRKWHIRGEWFECCPEIQSEIERLSNG